MNTYEIFMEPHSGVYSIEIKENLILHFAPAKLKELSGWDISDNGELLAYCLPWEDADQQQIERDLEGMKKSLIKVAGPIEGRKIADLAIAKIKEEEQ